MIKFDPSALTVKFVQLKTITTALGGSFTHVISEPGASKEVVERMVLPMSVARSFIKTCKGVTRHIKPLLVAVAMYEGRVVCLERHPLGYMGLLEDEGFDGKPRQWVPKCQANIVSHLNPLAYLGGEWYVDGRYVYQFSTNTLEQAALSGTPLTRDGRFRKVIARTIDLFSLDNVSDLEVADRSCLSFTTTSGIVAMSPPIWKDLANVGISSLGASSTEDDEEEDDDDGQDDIVRTQTRFTFDEIDNDLAVNLNFALKAGAQIGAMFGYEHVEPLQLPRLMIELHTVNLPTVSKQVKSTYDVNLNFTHALAWLLGMSRGTNTLDGYITMRSLMKYLTTKGIFRKSLFDANKVFQDQKTVEDVPLIPLADLLNVQMSGLSMLDIVSQAGDGIKLRKNKNHEMLGINGLLTEQ